MINLKVMTNSHRLYINSSTINCNFYLAKYDAKSLQRAQDFLTTCRIRATKDRNVWISFQSNVFADKAQVTMDFKPKFEDMKYELTRLGWVLPELCSNMRNQKNISRVTVKGNIEISKYRNIKMQDSITKLKSLSTVVGEVPTLVRIKKVDWGTKKTEVLKHVVDSMGKTNNNNLVILHDDEFKSRDIESEIKKITNKTIVTYPSPKNKQKSRRDIKNFVEKGNHILVTRDKFFRGSEASNVLHIITKLLLYTQGNVRSSFMRAVEELFVIQVITGSEDDEFNGLKEDNTFFKTQCRKKLKRLYSVQHF